MKKLRFHPFFIVLSVILIAFARFELLIISVLSALFHEYAHSLVARDLGYRMTRVTLMPYGAVLSGEERLYGKDLLKIAVAGPLSNLLLATLFTALWWVYPASYSYTLDLVRVNVGLAVFNLLPIYSLDGGRILLALSKNKKKALRFLKIAGIAGSAIFMSLFIMSAFFTINFTLGIASIMLFLGANGGTEQERYVQLCHELYCLKDFSRPIGKCEMYAHLSMPVSNLLKELKQDKFYIIYIIDNHLNTVKTIKGTELESLFSAENRGLTLESYCAKNVDVGERTPF